MVARQVQLHHQPWHRPTKTTGSTGRRVELEHDPKPVGDPKPIAPKTTKTLQGALKSLQGYKSCV